jgi:hypothetical protein
MFKPLLFTTFSLFIIVGGLIYYQDDNYFTKPQISKNNRLFPEQLDTKALNQIKIESQGSSVNLMQLKGGGWKEQSFNYEADPISIQDLLLNLSQIRLGDLVTNNPDHHKRFQLLTPPENKEDWSEDRHGISVSLLRGDGTSILSFLLGKNRISGSGQYARHIGSNKVFLIPEGLSIDSEANDWLKKDLLALESNQVQSLVLKNKEGGSFSINRDSAETDWKSSSAKSDVPDSDKITTLLNRLGKLSFSKLHINASVSQQAEATDLIETTLFVSLFDSRVYTLNLRNNIASNENYILSMRMGISLVSSGASEAEDSKLRDEMEIYNQQVNGRFYEISSWEGKELLLSE